MRNQHHQINKQLNASSEAAVKLAISFRAFQCLSSLAHASITWTPSSQHHAIAPLCAYASDEDIPRNRRRRKGCSRKLARYRCPTIRSATILVSITLFPQRAQLRASHTCSRQYFAKSTIPSKSGWIAMALSLHDQPHRSFPVFPVR